MGRSSVAVREIDDADVEDVSIESEIAPWEAEPQESETDLDKILSAADRNDENRVISLYFKEIQGHKLLSKKKQLELGMLIREYGDEKAKERLFSCNLRLVVSIAKKYFEGSHLKFMDIVQEGNMGLLKAVLKYDYRKGFMFTTYATPWIRQRITRAFHDQERPVRWPGEVGSLVRRVNRVFDEFADEFDREPDVHEVAEAASLSFERTEQILHARQQKVVSFDVSRQGHDGDAQSAWGEMFEDASHMDAFHLLAAKQELRAWSKKMRLLLRKLSSLPRREQVMFRRRYGLTGKDSQTLQQVADSMHPVITREWVRQIIEGVWKKLQEDGTDVNEMRSLLEDELDAIHRLENIVGEFADF